MSTRRKRVVILLVLVAFCVTAKALCPQFEPGLQVGTVAHYWLDEISGIAASRQNSNVLWVHNDAGGDPRVFAMNRQGTHLGIYNLSGAVNYDWEDIAIGPGPVNGVDYLYVGDIGDSGSRINIKVYRVAEPVVYSQQSPIETTLTGVDTITLQYPDGPRNAEALMVDPATKDIYIISKEDDYARLYRAPYPQSTTTTITMEYKCQFLWQQASGADISLNGDMIIVRNDDGDAAVWLRPAGTNLWDAFSTTQCPVQLLPEPNGEAICFDADGWGYYTTSEEAYQPIYYYASVNSNLAITEIMSQSAHSGSTDFDWRELTNTSLVSVDLTGYSWDDDHHIAGTVTFGNITIGPGESIIILDDNGGWTASWKSQWSLGGEVNVYDQSDFSGSFPGLGSSDGVFLYDPGDNPVTSVEYPSRTTGISNEWDTDRTFLDLSVIGENGAYQSSGIPPDVGSPGYAVTYYSCSEADIYTDGKIDFKDYSVLANDWLQEGPNLDGDITGNWIVNMSDLRALTLHWLNSCE